METEANRSPPSTTSMPILVSASGTEIASPQLLKISEGAYKLPNSS
jgi:hypothetical protein